MYKTIITLIFCSFTLYSSSFSQDMNASEIIQKANDVLNQESVFSKAKMTIITTSGKTRELFYDSWSKDKGRKSLIRYTAPPRIKEQAMLMLNNADDIWSYFPRTNRVRKLASHAKKQKMQGSDFSYEDMGSGDSFVTDFTHKYLKSEKKNGHDCHVIEMKAKEGVSSNYSKVTVWTDKENFVIWLIDYHDEKKPDMLTKTLTLSDMKIIDGVPTPMKMVMHNHLDNTNTTMEHLEIKYNITLDDAMFTERGLKK